MSAPDDLGSPRRTRDLNVRIAMLALAAMAAAAACGSPDSSATRPSPRRLSIATGGTGGVYYPYGGGIAKVISESLPGTRSDGRSHGGVGRQPQVPASGKADIAFTLADTLADAVKGRGAFEGRRSRRARWRCSTRTTRRS